MVASSNLVAPTEKKSIDNLMIVDAFSFLQKFLKVQRIDMGKKREEGGEKKEARKFYVGCSGSVLNERYFPYKGTNSFPLPSHVQHGDVSLSNMYMSRSETWGCFTVKHGHV